MSEAIGQLSMKLVISIGESRYHTPREKVKLMVMHAKSVLKELNTRPQPQAEGIKRAQFTWQLRDYIAEGRKTINVGTVSKCLDEIDRLTADLKTAQERNGELEKVLEIAKQKTWAWTSPTLHHQLKPDMAKLYDLITEALKPPEGKQD